VKQDKQPRRPSKPAALDQLQPPSDMGKRAKGGDKVSNPGVARRIKKSDQPATTSGGKGSR
jgi:hypothetical protein